MKRLGTRLIAGGATLWIAGVVAWMSGVWVTLPPDASRVLVLSFVAVTGGVLVTAGALVGRGRREHVIAASAMVEGGPESAPQPTDAATSHVRTRAPSVYDRVP